MKERSVLFNSDMVRAILAGQKTQTRRPVRPQPQGGRRIFQYLDGWRFEGCDYEIGAFEISPFGQSGDILWVRETWRYASCAGYTPINKEPKYEAMIEYKATYCKPIDGDRGGRTFQVNQMHYPGGITKGGDVAWKPSVHMPRWACRITLDVKRVWVELIQNISLHPRKATAKEIESVKAEGITSGRWDEFAHLWDSIYAKKGYGWDRNPWVWCCEFEVVDDKKSKDQ